jgi:hypothetical protein
MEAWGIIMTALTLFGMLALVVADVGASEGEAHVTSATVTDGPTGQPAEVKKAA